MFVDTGAWYALADRSDRHHDRARKFYLTEAPAGRLVTTDLVVAETWALLGAHLGRAAAIAFWDTLRMTRIPVLPLDIADLEAAWRIVEAFPGETFSFTDCTSFVLMRHLKLREALTTDHHFVQAGFVAQPS